MERDRERKENILKDIDLDQVIEKNIVKIDIKKIADQEKEIIQEIDINIIEMIAEMPQSKSYNYRDEKQRKDERRQREKEDDEKFEQKLKNKIQVESEKDVNLNYLSNSQDEKSLRQRNRDNSKQQQQGDGNDDDEKQNEDKEIPNYEASGLLAEFENKINGTVQKFTESQDAAVPVDTWRIYPFKGEEELSVLQLKGSSYFLFGKDLRIAHIHLPNPSCSGQHAVIQFREKRQLDELQQNYTSEIKPYLMDLESTNGTYLNGEKIEPARYYQLLHKDMLKFGSSDREYLIMKF